MTPRCRLASIRRGWGEGFRFGDLDGMRLRRPRSLKDEASASPTFLTGRLMLIPRQPKSSEPSMDKFTKLTGVAAPLPIV